MFSDTTPEYWFEISKHDQDAVSQLLNIGSHPDIIIYHMHQAIEKQLKGFILQNGGKLQFIHDLEKLFQILMDHNNSFLQAKDAVIGLHSYFSDLRYPVSDFLNQSDLLDASSYYQLLLDEFC